MEQPISGRHEVIGICNQLAEAVAVIHNPNSSSELRTEAYNVCETFKDTSPISTECACYLLRHNSDLVRHFALQLMEHRIKYKWYEIDIAEKLSIREKTLQAIGCCCDDNDVSLYESLIGNYAHLKDVLTRIMVEMIKREWPQNWSDLFPQLYATANRGSIQSELILLILLRLIEDVAVLHTCPLGQRKKDICQALTSEVDNIQVFLLHVMNVHYLLASSSSSSSSSSVDDISGSVKIVRLGLVVLSELIQWIPLNRLLSGDSVSRVLGVLSVVVSNDYYLSEAIDCVIQILSRKGKLDEVNSLATNFFRSGLIERCVDRTNLLLLNDYEIAVDENNYKVALKISELLLSTSQLLSLLTDKCDGRDNVLSPLLVENATAFELYLDTLTIFVKFNSLRLLYNVAVAWKDLFRAKYFNERLPLSKYLPNWIDWFASKLVRVPYNDEDNNTSDLFRSIRNYIVYEFDSEQEYTKFYHRFRTELLLAYRYATPLAPTLMFAFIDRLTTNCIAKSRGGPHNELYAIWEPLIQLIELVAANLPASCKSSLETDGLRLLNLCLKTETTDPTIMSNLLTCLSNLTYFLDGVSFDVKSTVFSGIIDRAIYALVFPLNDNRSMNNNNINKKIRTLRRHAGSLLIKMSRTHSDLMVRFFDYLYDAYGKLTEPNNKSSSSSDDVIVDENDDRRQYHHRRLGYTERVLMLEVLILLNNRTNDFQRQFNFIQTISVELNDYFAGTLSIFDSGSTFLNYLGLNNDDVVTEGAENRSKLIHAVDTLNAILARSSVPLDDRRPGTEDKLTSFVFKYKPDGSPIYTNPCASLASNSTPFVLSLTRTLNSLWSDTNLSIDRNALNITDNEIKSLIETIGLEKPTDDLCYYYYYYSDLNKDDESPSTANNTRRIIAYAQNYIGALYEKTIFTVSRICRCSPYDIFDRPQFLNDLSMSIFHNLDNVPDFRLKLIVKHPIKTVVTHCPSEYRDVILIPLFEYATEYMYGRLTSRWLYVEQLGRLTDERDDTNISSSNNDKSISKDILEILIVQKLTNEYIAVVKLLLTISDDDNNSNNEQLLLSNVDNVPNNNSNNNNETLSNLGLKILQNDRISLWIMKFLSDVVSWQDSDISLKATVLLTLIMKQMIVRKVLTSEIATDFLLTFLQGIHVHGQHESNLGVLVQSSVWMYDLFRINCPNLLETMKRIPDVNLDELRKFDEHVLKTSNNTNQNPNNISYNISNNNNNNVNNLTMKVDRGKREKFKKLVAPIIGLQLNELYKRKPLIRDLPRFDTLRTANVRKHNTNNILSYESSNSSQNSPLGLIGQLLK